MIETSPDQRTQRAYAKAHEARGDMLRQTLRWVFRRK